MHSSPNRKTTDDPHDFVVVPPDHVRVGPSDAEISDLLRAAARQHADQTAGAGSGSPVPPVDTTFRATGVNDDLLNRRQTAHHSTRDRPPAVEEIIVDVSGTKRRIDWRDW